jgi:hypothetical protein
VAIHIHIGGRLRMSVSVIVLEKEVKAALDAGFAANFAG